MYFAAVWKELFLPFGNHSLQSKRMVFMSQNIQDFYSSPKRHWHRNEGLGLISVCYINSQSSSGENTVLEEVPHSGLTVCLPCWLYSESRHETPSLPTYTSALGCVNIFPDAQSFNHWMVFILCGREWFYWHSFLNILPRFWLSYKVKTSGFLPWTPKINGSIPTSLPQRYTRMYGEAI